MGIDISTWSCRIGRFHSKTLRYSNIAHGYDIVLCQFMTIVTLLTITEVGLIIGSFGLNPGPPGQQNLSNSNGKYDDFVVNCNVCGLIWSAQDVGLIGNSYDDLVNSTFTC